MNQEKLISKAKRLKQRKFYKPEEIPPEAIEAVREALEAEYPDKKFTDNECIEAVKNHVKDVRAHQLKEGARLKSKGISKSKKRKKAAKLSRKGNR